MRTKRLMLGMLPFLGFTALSSGCGVILGLDQFSESAATSGATSSSGGSTGGSGGMGTGSTTTATAGTGGGTMCTPDAVEACYDGPVASRATGTCKDGKHTCKADGSGWGACVGEVLPAAEDPSTPTDENCDGLASGDTVWAKRFGDDTAQVATSVAVDGTGNIYVTGYFNGTIQFGSSILTATGTADIFVAKLDPAGSTLWAKRLGGAGSGIAQSIALDSKGNIILTGTSSGALDFGGPTIGVGIFVVKLDSMGMPLWSRDCGGSAGIYPTSPRAVLDAKGDVFLAANFDGTVNCGTASYKAVGDDDILLAKLSGLDGAAVWSYQFGTMSSEEVGGIAVDSSGNVLISGGFDQTIVLQSSNLINAGGHDIFTAKFDTNGKIIWADNWGDSSDQGQSGLAVDSLGGPVLGGSLGTSAFGLTSSGYSDAFVVRLTSTGTYSWGKAFGGTNKMSSAYGKAIATDATGGAILGGTFAGNMSLGSDVSASTSLMTAFVARVDPQGSLLWGKAFADADVNAKDAVDDLKFGPNGEAILVGHVSGQVKFGTSPLPGAHGLFVAKLAP